MFTLLPLFKTWIVTLTKYWVNSYGYFFVLLAQDKQRATVEEVWLKSCRPFESQTGVCLEDTGTQTCTSDLPLQILQSGLLQEGSWVVITVFSGF